MIFFENEKDKEIALEEILSDLEAETEDSYTKSPVSVFSIKVFLYAFFLICVLFFSYIVYLFLDRGETSVLISKGNASQVYNFGSSRGEIKAQDGTVLATSSVAFNVVANPSLFSDEIEIKEAISELFLASDNLNMGAIKNKLIIYREKNFGYVETLKNLNNEESARVFSVVEKYDALSLRETSIRYYPYAERFAHILGYVSGVSREDVARDQEYSFINQSGKQGIELKFEDEMRGESGIFIKYQDAFGQDVEERLVRPPKKGGDIITTLFPTLQEIAYEELDAELSRIYLANVEEKGSDAEPLSGVVIVLDPRSGAVRASVSLPAFNPNELSSGLSLDKVDEYFGDDSSLFFNRSVSGLYPSGSLIKPFLAVAALEEGIIDPLEKIKTEGYITVDSVFDPEESWTFLDWKNHGAVDMRRAIAVSSNAYFYIVGGGYQDREGLGITKIAKWMNNFYWGRSLEINFDLDAKGRVPDPKWKREQKSQKWYIGDTYNTSIGQGDILVSPLKIAASMSAIVNGGTLYKPYVVDRIEYGDGSIKKYLPDPLVEDIASQESLLVAREGMRDAVLEGSVRSLSSLKYSFAGKTGTAQAGRSDSHAFFVGFGPYEDPEFVIVVLLEKGQDSSRAVAVAHLILKRYYDTE